MSDDDRVTTPPWQRRHEKPCHVFTRARWCTWHAVFWQKYGDLDDPSLRVGISHPCISNACQTWQHCLAWSFGAVSALPSSDISNATSCAQAWESNSSIQFCRAIPGATHVPENLVSELVVRPQRRGKAARGVTCIQQPWLSLIHI